MSVKQRTLPGWLPPWSNVLSGPDWLQPDTPIDEAAIDAIAHGTCDHARESLTVMVAGGKR